MILYIIIIGLILAIVILCLWINKLSKRIDALQADNDSNTKEINNTINAITSIINIVDIIGDRVEQLYNDPLQGGLPERSEGNI